LIFLLLPLLLVRKASFLDPSYQISRASSS
jgi:hypothetical protein